MAGAGLIPQKIDMDDGNFPIAHTALLTLSKTKLSGAQRAVVDVVFTQTYGYHNEASPYDERLKKRHIKAQISHEFFEQATWMGKQEISRAISALIKWGIIGRDKNTSPYTYFFNVRSGEWSPDCWRISRIVNSKQDSEQLTGQLTKCSQDSLQGVSRIANSKQVLSLAAVSANAPLKKREKNKKKIKDLFGDTHTSEKVSPKDFLALDNFEKVEAIKTLPFNQQITCLVLVYNKTFPKQAQTYDTGGTIKARKTFEEAVKKFGILPDQILIEILWNQEEDEPKPWELVNCLKGKKGLEQTEAQVVYGMGKYDREVGIKDYGPAQARDAP